ncbi:hypothetical protein JCM10212_001504 [Sporobolomyces blumeae]
MSAPPPEMLGHRSTSSDSLDVSQDDTAPPLSASTMPADADPAPPSPTNSSTWHARLAEARLALAHKVQEQQRGDGWIGAEGEREATSESAAIEATGGDPEGLRHRRRTSAVTDDGEEDDFVAEMLRPGSRPSSASDVKPPTCDAESEPAAEREARDDHSGHEATGSTDNDKTCRICFDGEDEELGKLFSPCRCRGTSRYVHTHCLAAWRKASANSKSFYACDLCGFRYKFRRTLVGNLINSRFTVLLFTSWLFLFLVWSSGFLANSLLSVVESRSNALQGTVFDDFFVADHILLGEGVRESLSFVTHQLEDSRWPTARKLAQQAHLGTDDENESSSRFFGFGAAPKARAGNRVDDPGMWARVVLHMTKGASLLGLLSVFYTYIAATFVSPLGRTLFRAIRPAGGRRRAGDNSASISQVVIILVVIVGIARAIRQVYRGTRWLCKVALSRIEDLVIEVN